MVSPHPGARPATGIAPYRVADLILQLTGNNHTQTKTGRGSGRLSLFQNQLTKNGSDLAMSGPLFISASSFALFAAHP
jgi:hypothetical protein